MKLPIQMEYVGLLTEAHWADVLSGCKIDITDDFPAVVYQLASTEGHLAIVKLMDRIERDHGATIRYKYPMYINPITFEVYDMVQRVQPLTVYEYHAALMQQISAIGATP